MDFLTLLIVVALAYVAYINRDRLKAAINKDDVDEEPDVAEQAPIVAPPATPNYGTIAPNSGASAPNPGAAKPESGPVYSGVGDPPSQEAWAAWLATLDPMTRRYYPPVWKPTPVQEAAVETVPIFKPLNGNLITDTVLMRGSPVLATGTLGVVMSFPVPPGANRVSIAETSGSGDHVRYNLWISDEPNGAGDSEQEFQYNTATRLFKPTDKVVYANVRALVDGGRAFYIQSN